MTEPARLQLSRAKGFNLQAHSRAINGLEAVNVARPTRWGNPFTARDCRKAGYVGSSNAIASRVASAFRAWLDSPHWRENWDGPESENQRQAILLRIRMLRGKNLACWCKPGEPCHADVLLEIANRPVCEAVG